MQTMRAVQISRLNGPRDHVAEAYERMMSGKARFCVVLDLAK